MKKKYQKKPKEERKRGKNTNNHYFTKEHEDKIIEYNSEEDSRKREALFIQHIQPVLDKMIEKIVITFKFNALENIDVLKEECKLWIPSVLGKYDPSKKSTAFSYFSVIIKNWFLAQQKKQKTKKEREVQFIDLDEFSDYSEDSLIYYNTYMEDREKLEFLDFFKENIKKWYFKENDPNKKKIIMSIIIIINEAQDVDFFSKRDIYYYIREITKLPTKQIALVVKQLSARYKALREEWINDG